MVCVWEIYCINFLYRINCLEEQEGRGKAIFQTYTSYAKTRHGAEAHGELALNNQTCKVTLQSLLLPGFCH